MPHVKVHVLGHTQDPRGDGKPKVRLVTVPDDAPFETDEDKCNAAFQYGQNDFSAGNPEHNTTFSVSVGDVVEVPAWDDPEADYTLYVVCGVGFKAITSDEFEMLKGLSSADRTFHPLCRG